MADVVDIDRINELHRRIRARGEHALGWAMECGDELIRAQQLVPPGKWVAWLRSNVEVHPTTAFGYMRLARNREQVEAGGFSGIDPALAALSDGRTLTPEVREEMRRLYNNGRGQTLEEIAEAFGVRKSTVWYHVSAKRRDRIKRVQRRTREQSRRALERERERAAMLKLKDPVGKAYGLVRKAEQALDKRLSEEPLSTDERLAISEALNALYTAEDQLVRASRAR